MSQSSRPAGGRKGELSSLASGGRLLYFARNMATADEKVLVFPRSLLEQLGVFQGFSREVNRYLPAILEKKNNSFMARAQAETNPAFKQVIPYVVITDGQSVLHYVRGKKAGEQRLVAKGSVGIGGHINNEDETLFGLNSFGLEAFRDAVKREVCEELSIQGELDARPVGLINDDSTEVGQVHFGVVHVFFCRPENVKRKEQVITQMEFVPIAELKAKREQMETWSQLCIDHLDAFVKPGA
jgi:predicted NUDIX family phosphoesterase